jgi:hypothetical protein
MHAFEGSVLENQTVSYAEIQQFLEGYGFVVGGGWESDHGYFDKKLKDKPGDLYLRIPAFVQEGNFGEADATLRLGTPFMLQHQYERGNDEQADPSLLSASINQFAEPEDADAPINREDIEAGESELKQVEQGFRQYFLS